MPSIVLPNVSDELHGRLIRAAERSGRSPDQKAIELLDQALRPAVGVVLPSPIVPLRPITEEEIAAAIREGRE